MTINIVSRSNRQIANRYGTSVRPNGVTIKKSAAATDFNVHRELFFNGEQGIWLNPDDMSTAKTTWRRNLLTYSQELNNAAWTNLNATVTANSSTAPDGTSTADKVIRTAGSGIRGVQPPFSSSVDIGETYTFSLYAKANGLSFVGVVFYNNQGRVVFNLTDQTNVIYGSTGSASVTLTAVVTMYSEISTDSTEIRTNSVLRSNSVSEQGSGDYGNYPLYIGRRGGTSVPFNGNIYGLVIRGRNTLPTVVVSTEKYIARNTGLSI